MHPLPIRLRATLSSPSSRYYLSHDGTRALGPFPIHEVKWMIRCGHFSRDVLIRLESAQGWTPYRQYAAGSVVKLMLCAIISPLERVGVFSMVERLLRRMPRSLGVKTIASSPRCNPRG